MAWLIDLTCGFLFSADCVGFVVCCMIGVWCFTFLRLCCDTGGLGVIVYRLRYDGLVVFVMCLLGASLCIVHCSSFCVFFVCCYYFVLYVGTGWVSCVCCLICFRGLCLFCLVGFLSGLCCGAGLSAFGYLLYLVCLVSD